MAIHLTNVLDIATRALAPTALMALAVVAVPSSAPLLWWFAGAGLLWGAWTMSKRYPRDWFPLLMVYAPIAGALVFYCALLISWQLNGDRL